MCRAVEFKLYARNSCYSAIDRYLENDCLYKCVFKWDLKQATVLDFKASTTFGWRLFQICGAWLVNAVRTPSETVRRWRADDCRACVGSCHWRSDDRYSGWPVGSALQVNKAILYVIFDWIGSQCSLLSIGVILSNLHVRFPTRAIEFCRHCSFTIFVKYLKEGLLH